MRWAKVRSLWHRRDDEAALAHPKGDEVVPVKRVLVSEEIAPEALDLLRADCEVHYDESLHARPEDLARALPGIDALLVRNGTRVDERVVAAADRLRVLGRIGVGLDNLDLPALRAKGVTVTYAPAANSTSVAEYVIGAAFTLARRYAPLSAAAHAGIWDRTGAAGMELHGKTMGIVGLGEIGSRVARRAAALGMRLLAYSPGRSPNSFSVQELGVELTSLERLLANADVLTLHTPLTHETRGLLGEENLTLMKPGAYLINTARGGLVDESALARSLESGRLAGAALDVRDPEPPVPPDPLAGLDNLILTPHVAGMTRESLQRACLYVAEDVLAVLSGDRPRSEVTPLVR